MLVDEGSVASLCSAHRKWVAPTRRTFVATQQCLRVYIGASNNRETSCPWGNVSSMTDRFDASHHRDAIGPEGEDLIAVGRRQLVS